MQCSHPPLPFPPALLLVTRTNPNDETRRDLEPLTGRKFAVTTIPKVLEDPTARERTRAEQIPYLRREVEVLLALRG